MSLHNKQRAENDSPIMSHQHSRNFHSTPQREMFVYASIILGVAISYVGYKTYHGEPLKPKSASGAQEAYHQWEDEKVKRNKKQPKYQTFVKDPTKAETKSSLKQDDDTKQ